MKSEWVELGDVVLAPAGAIEGVVLLADGSPAAGAWVALYEGPPMNRSEYSGERLYRSARSSGGIRADEFGRFRLEGVPVGQVRLWAGVETALACLTAPIEVRRGQRSTGVEIILG